MRLVLFVIICFFLSVYSFEGSLVCLDRVASLFLVVFPVYIVDLICLLRLRRLLSLGA